MTALPSFLPSYTEFFFVSICAAPTGRGRDLPSFYRVSLFCFFFLPCFEGKTRIKREKKRRRGSSGEEGATPRVRFTPRRLFFFSLFLLFFLESDGFYLYFHCGSRGENLLFFSLFGRDIFFLSLFFLPPFFFFCVAGVGTFFFPHSGNISTLHVLLLFFFFIS